MPGEASSMVEGDVVDVDDYFEELSDADDS